VEIAGANLSWFTIWFVVILLVECALLYVLLQKTKLGLSLRAVASNQESSKLVGIDVGTMLMVGWGLAAAIGSLAGAILASRTNQFDVSMMQFILAYAFAAAALGGFDSPLGAVVAGFIVGVAEALAITYIDAVEGIPIVVPLLLIFFVLLFRPQGMFGRKVVERV
jgi:branched-chain amino acid transport system permease protein